MCKHENLVDSTSFDESAENKKSMLCTECGDSFIIPIDYEKNIINQKLKQVQYHIEGMMEGD